MINVLQRAHNVSNNYKGHLIFIVLLVFFEYSYVE